MKSIIMPENAALAQDKNNLNVEEVKETLAPAAVTEEAKELTHADMWNLQRKSRSASDRMRRWNLN